MKTLLTGLIFAACALASPIYAPGQSELAVYNFDGSVAASIAPDFFFFVTYYNQQQSLNPDQLFPRYGIYACAPYCPDFTGVTYAPYGPNAPRPNTTPEPGTMATAVTGGVLLLAGFMRRQRFIPR